MVDASDGRNFRRMTVNCAISIQPTGQKNIFSGVANNLSATGLSFICAEQFSENDILDIDIPPGKEGATLPFRAEVKVVRVDDVGEQQYSVGCEIINIKD